MYNKRQFGAEMILKLEEGASIDSISCWADKIYYKHFDEIDDELSVQIQNIASMSFGSDFVYTKDELNNLAIKLITD